MQTTVSHPTYGIITYEESFWTGKRIITFDGIPLTKINKTTYQYQSLSADPFAASEESASAPVTVTVKGNYISGVSLVIGDETVTLTAKATVLDFVLGCIPAGLFFAFVIGGAIGGGLSALIGMGLTILMKTRKKTIHKVLICIGLSIAVLAVGIPLLLAALAAQA